MATIAILFWCAAGLAQGYAPGEAAQHMTVPDGFQVKLVASEPMIAQPVAIEFDDRGRLWVIQYLQYPNPAGLQRAKVDRWSRTVYDKVPEPPPRGPKGADRITILEDFGADGHARKAKDFVSGLNLTTGIAFGHGGVFVLQVPYLLFYPDRNGDDVPDSDPEVLLTGFGMQDAHSVANSLTWGPDGWLYGCQGSTVTAKIRGIEFQQGVWRYHPITHTFELFCEGGGNSWGLDFDEDGNLIYSTNFGGYRMFHGVQGAYYWKSFGKHGALHNPFAFGYFDHVPHANFTGGHVTVGGIIYQGDSFPEKFRGKYIVGDLLGHGVQWHNMEPWGSTFKSSHGGELLVANDNWFASSDVTMGPDGAVYVADWFDKRTAHPDPDADWDRSNGRIYKIEAKGTKPVSVPDLTRLTSRELIALLSSKNDWYVRKARRILADRRDRTMIPALRKMVFENKDEHLTLEALWALYVSGGVNKNLVTRLLSHPNAHVREWMVRWLGDEGKTVPEMELQLIKLAATDADVHLRSQLAATAKRLPAKVALPIVQQLAVRNLDAQDAYIPLLLWWAVERHAMADREQVLRLFGTASAWQTPIIRDVILERLMRRYAAEGTELGYSACAQLLESAPEAKDRSRMLAALEQGLRDRPSGDTGPNQGGLFENQAVVELKPVAKTSSVEKIPASLEKQLSALWSDDTTDLTLIRLMASFGKPSALTRALNLAVDKHAAVEARTASLQLLGELGRPDCVPALLKLVAGSEPEGVRLAALAALQSFDQSDISVELLRQYPAMNGRLRSRTREVLLSRKDWARAFLQEVDGGKCPASEVPVEQLREISLYQDRQLDDLVRKLWGNISSGTPEEKLAEMRRLNNDLRAGSGDPIKGREVFKNTCAVCHRLFDEGGQIGPDLTHANRKDQSFLLASIVDPSAVIRKEFLSYNVETTDGRFFSGLIGEQSPSSVTILMANNERATINRDKIKSLQESAVSLMPENLLKTLKPQELRDLFGYLQSEKTSASK
ncbi:MAG: c-type cytochrome [Verrucomicrobia bacterium]|nr:c-type cytochrome [Verrucomicrobiota bacterium]